MTKTVWNTFLDANALHTSLAHKSHFTIVHVVLTVVFAQKMRSQPSSEYLIFEIATMRTKCKNQKTSSLHTHNGMDDAYLANMYIVHISDIDEVSTRR